MDKDWNVPSMITTPDGSKHPYPKSYVNSLPTPPPRRVTRWKSA